MPRFFTSSAEKARRRNRNIARLIKKQSTPAASQPGVPPCQDADLLICLGVLQYYGPLNVEQIQIKLSLCGVFITQTEIERVIIFYQKLQIKEK